MSRKIKLRLLFAGVVVALCVTACVAAELAVRWFVPVAYWRQRNGNDDWQLDERVGWVQKPFLDVSYRDGASIIRFQTNPDGLYPATARPERGKEQLRIMLFGDSTVVGRSVPEDERLAANLERQLAAHGIAAEVLCAGVQGYSTDQALILMERLVPRYQPDFVFHVTCANDLGGNELDEAYGYAKPRFELQPGGILQELSPDLKLSADRRSRNSTRFKDLLQLSALYRLNQPLISRVRFRGNLREGNLVGLESEIIYSSPSVLDQYNWALLQALFKRMNEVARANGARLLLYCHPGAEEVWNTPLGMYDRYAIQRRVEAVCGSNNIPFCPLIDYFLAHRNRGPFHLLPRDSRHCNGMGYRLTAERLVTFLLESSSLGKTPAAASP